MWTVDVNLDLLTSLDFLGRTGQAVAAAPVRSAGLCAHGWFAEEALSSPTRAAVRILTYMAMSNPALLASKQISINKSLEP